MNKIAALKKKKAALVQQSETLNEQLSAEGITAEQEATISAQIDANLAEIRKVNGSIERETALAEARRELGGVEISDDADISGGTPQLANDPQHGFKSFGEFAGAVRMACRKSQPVIDQRFQILGAAPTTASNESVGEDGGYVVPPQYRTDIMEVVAGEESLFGMTDQTPIERNSIKLPVDETTPWDSTNGIQAAWEDELAELNQSKIKLTETEFNARKVTSLVPVSSELLEDAGAMDSYLRRKAPEKISFKVDLGVVRGNGVGKPLGFLNSDALITVAKESGQAADSIVAANINNMWSRLPAWLRRQAVWLINQDIEPQLESLAFTGSESPVPLFVPAGGISASPYNRLKGRPIIPHQAMSTLGDVGDIALVVPKQYGTVVKRGGVKVDVSMHLYFDADAMAFRFILRVGGHPYLSAPIQPLNGSNTLSPFVTLAARA